MKPVSGDDRTTLARVAADTFVVASLACMEHADPGSPADRRCERLFERAHALQASYVDQLRRTLQKSSP